MRAIALLSGGLDSTLAARMMLDQGVAVTGITFTSPVTTCGTRTGSGNGASRAAATLGIPLRAVPLDAEYFRMVGSPKYGHGSAFNPCIDCHIYMVSLAFRTMRDEDASFIVTGEVVGQRPMSQMKPSLRCVERDSGAEGLLLRPLSARLLPPTIPETKGWIDREQLLDISGRGRSRQFELARRFGITDYPMPGGGCLLTDRNIARRLRDLYAHTADITVADISLVCVGRQFRLSPSTKLIVARNEDEAHALREGFRPDRDTFLYCKEPMGPAALVRNSLPPFDPRIFEIIYRYSDAETGNPLHIVIEGVGAGALSVSFAERSGHKDLLL